MFGLAGNTYEFGDYDLIIGPLLVKEGDPVPDALVTIDIGGTQISTLTDTDGDALFTISKIYFDNIFRCYDHKGGVGGPGL